MIHIERAGAEDLETIIAIQRSGLRPFMRNYQVSDPYLEERGGFTGSWLSGPIVLYFVKTARKILSFIRLNTNDEQTAGWIGTVAILPECPGLKRIWLWGLVWLRRNSLPLGNGICVQFFSGQSMVAFYEKRHRTHIELKGMDMILYDEDNRNKQKDCSVKF